MTTRKWNMTRSKSSADKQHYLDYTISDFKKLVLDRQLFQDNYENENSNNFRNYVNSKLGIAWADWAGIALCGEDGEATYDLDEMSDLLHHVVNSCLNNKDNVKFFKRSLEDGVAIIATEDDDMWTCYDGMDAAIYHIWKEACNAKLYEDMYYDYESCRYNEDPISRDAKAEEWIFPNDVKKRYTH